MSGWRWDGGGPLRHLVGRGTLANVRVRAHCGARLLTTGKDGNQDCCKKCMEHQRRYPGMVGDAPSSVRHSYRCTYITYMRFPEQFTAIPACDCGADAAPPSEEKPNA